MHSAAVLSRPTLSRRPWPTALRFAVGVPAVLLSATLLIALAVAWCWPDDGASASGWAGRFVLLRFYARVFQMHIALAAIAAAAFATVVRFWRIGLILVLAGAFALLPYAREYAPKPRTQAGPTIRVLSMNLFAINRDDKAIFAAIDDANADVIVACEATEWSRREIFAKLATRYPYAVNRYYASGEIVLSRLPFTMEGTPRAIVPRAPLTFVLDGRPLALYVVHTTSPGAVSRLMLNRGQTRQLTAAIANETRPMIAVGDFNFSQLTPNYGWITAAGLRSTHDIVGFGVGNTWGPKWDPTLNRLPGIRIDQMFLSKELTATSHRVGLYDGSDHRPIIADVGFAVATP